MLKGRPVFNRHLLDLKQVKWTSRHRLAPGKHKFVFDFNYDGLGFATLAFNNLSGIGRGGTGAFGIDGKEVARQSLDCTVQLILPIDESFDVGSDT